MPTSVSHSRLVTPCEKGALRYFFLVTPSSAGCMRSRVEDRATRPSCILVSVEFTSDSQSETYPKYRFLRSALRQAKLPKAGNTRNGF